MAKARSPGYPSIGLGTAIEKVEAVYKKDAQNSIPREVVARHAGYNGITGNSLSMLSSLLKFGLLIGRGDNTSVSDLALQIIAHPNGSPERRAAILEAAFSPALFAEIRDHFKSGKVSDHALRAYLLTRKFLPGAVDGVIRAYRETISLVEAQSVGYNAASSDEPEPQTMESSPQVGAHGAPQPGRSQISPEEVKAFIASQINRATLPLEEGTAVLEIPAAITKRSHNKLKLWLELLLKLAEEDSPSIPSS
jgi:hypothetical protein